MWQQTETVRKTANLKVTHKLSDNGSGVNVLVQVASQNCEWMNDLMDRPAKLTTE